jgi:hypothetical protein
MEIKLSSLDTFFRSHSIDNPSHQSTSSFFTLASVCYKMSSPVHQKYSSQSHKIFNNDPVPAMPEAPKQDNERRPSDASVGSEGFNGRRRSSAAQRFGNLEALKRRQDEESMARRQSFHDAYGKPGILGTWWNNFTRGPLQSQPKNGSS